MKSYSNGSSFIIYKKEDYINNETLMSGQMSEESIKKIPLKAELGGVIIKNKEDLDVVINKFDSYTDKSVMADRILAKSLAMGLPVIPDSTWVKQLDTGVQGNIKKFFDKTGKASKGYPRLEDLKSSLSVDDEIYNETIQTILIEIGETELLDKLGKYFEDSGKVDGDGIIELIDSMIDHIEKGFALLDYSENLDFYDNEYRKPKQLAKCNRKYQLILDSCDKIIMNKKYLIDQDVSNRLIDIQYLGMFNRYGDDSPYFKYDEKKLYFESKAYLENFSKIEQIKKYWIDIYERRNNIYDNYIEVVFRKNIDFFDKLGEMINHRSKDDNERSLNYYGDGGSLTDIKNRMLLLKDLLCLDIRKCARGANFNEEKYREILTNELVVMDIYIFRNILETWSRKNTIMSEIDYVYDKVVKLNKELEKVSYVK